jgi:hypothetical protein
MKTCPYCQHQFEGDPRYCPNCGRVNYDDVTRNMLWVRQRIESGTATQDDLAFIRAVQKDVESAKPMDFRAPFEKFLDWWGWWIVIIVTGGLAIWGNLNEFLTLFLFGFSLSIAGLISTRKSLRGRAEVYSIFFLIGGVLIMGYAIFTGLASALGF